MQQNNLKNDCSLKFSDYKEFGVLLWNLCLVCGCVSVKTTTCEDGPAEQGAWLTCRRVSEMMELEDITSQNKSGR